MLALWIVLGILLLFILLGFLPVGITAEYKERGLYAAARIGAFQLQIYPPKKKKEPDMLQKENAQETTAMGEKHPKGGALGAFRELIGLAMQAQADIRDKLRIRELILYLTVGGEKDDPAAAGILIGSAWAALGNLIPLLESSFRIEKQDIQANVDFLSEETRVYAKATATISLGAGIRLVGYYGVQGLKWYRKQKQKGGNEHGTSNR